MDSAGTTTTPGVMVLEVKMEEVEVGEGRSSDAAGEVEVEDVLLMRVPTGVVYSGDLEVDRVLDVSVTVTLVLLLCSVLEVEVRL